MADITIPFECRVTIGYGPDLTPWQLRRAIKRARKATRVAEDAACSEVAWGISDARDMSAPVTEWVRVADSAPGLRAAAQSMWGEAAVLLLWVLLAEPLASDPEAR